MPTTVNGIGTHYYGRKNRTFRPSTCKSCNRHGNLESYDTTLWFVVVFIPLIPLGRKRIIDQCPSCSRHYVMKADAYEQAKQLQISGSMEQFRREPSVDSALAVHAQLLAFHEHDQAAEFRQSAVGQFPRHAGLRVGLASHLREMSQFDESARFYREALDLDPDLPEARVGVASRKMAEGDLDGARKLLDYLTKPGEGQRSPLGPIDVLAGCYQRAGRHQEALELAKVLLRELPKLEEEHAFRAFVKKSEKALGVPDSILPERSFSVSGLFRSEGSPFAPWQRRLAIGTVVVGLLAGGLAFNNEYIRQHRTVHVLNATGQPAQVQVDDQPAVSLTGLGKLTVPEGSHVVKVSGPVAEAHTVSLEGSYFGRWFGKPAWVLNLGGEAVVEEITHVYSANGSPSTRRLVVGEPFLHRPEVDYLFSKAPDQIQVKNRTEQVTKTEINWLQGEDAGAFEETIRVNPEAALKFAEARLRRDPKQSELLRLYTTACPDQARIEKFLEPGLARRPVEVQWHRAYQNAAELNRNGDLIARYDKFLEAEPANAALLYLRGRIDPEWDAQEPFYRRSIEADPKFGWPWMAIAARAGAEARWDESVEAARKARELKVDEADRLGDLLHDARMARGEADALVAEYRQASAARPQDVPTLLFLVDALAASGRGGEIDKSINNWIMRLPPMVQPQAAPPLRALGLYYAGKLDECAKFSKGNGVLKPSAMHIHALLALGRTAEAADESTFRTPLADPFVMLELAVALDLDGKAEDAARWRDKAVADFEKLAGSTEVARMVRFFKGPGAPTVSEVDHLSLPASNKSLLLASLAGRFPDARASFLAEAGKFNSSRKPPHYLIRRALEGKPADQP